MSQVGIRRARPSPFRCPKEGAGVCGIVGYVGEGPVLPFLLEGLKRLEYRGYDSAGVAVLEGERISVKKRMGRIAQLEVEVNGEVAIGSHAETPGPTEPSATEHCGIYPASASQKVSRGGGLTENLMRTYQRQGLNGAWKVGIGHTRWATHGKPSDANAHPHCDCHDSVAVVHNGIIENYAELKGQLLERGHRFRSETDTEVIAHLIEEFFGEGNGMTLEDAVRKTAGMLRGSFAIGVISVKEPVKLVAVRNQSPLVLGLGEKEYYLASDIPAILARTKRTMILEDGDMAVISPDGVKIMEVTGEGKTKVKEITVIPWNAEMAEKGGYPHFMLKEIHEQPRALRETLVGRVDPVTGEAVLEEIEKAKGSQATVEAALKLPRRVFVVACGTAYHAGLVGRVLIERLTGIPVEVDLASEFRYREPIIGPEDLLVVVSQSGETADTLAALREGRRLGVPVIAVTNVMGSSVAREADYAIMTRAGPEIAVASTKAYTTQIVCLGLLAMKLAEMKVASSHSRSYDADGVQIYGFGRALLELPARVEQVLQIEPEVEEVAEYVSGWDDAFFIGRGVDFASVLEGQLKLKEISYIHAEAYAAGELKHGTLALITEGVPVIAAATQEHLFEKTLSNVMEVRARGAWVTLITTEELYRRIKGDSADRAVDRVLLVPSTHPLLQPVITAVPLQLLAYYAARRRGCDIDKPRNLAKSVTVE
ncbi:MAG TPA: glutamine--fructose-6-phosphate transaminase (isomerizing) [Clostridia bacterium]|nr:glutamine--fructose-6-phosphate transaminase (isomerizing) [Clostridia bacterium]